MRAAALAVVVLGLGASALLGAHLDEREPRGDVVPAPPSPLALRAQALGDGQFAFRARSLQLQHLGNLGGRVVPYKAMDYGRLEEWFRTLDRLDARSDVVPMSAALLYSGTQTPPDVRHIVAYLADHVRRAPGREWRWMTHAIYLARFRLEDSELALDLARELAAFEAGGIPAWARNLRVLVLADMGRTEAARALVRKLVQAEGMPRAERRWLRYYLKRELQADTSPLRR
ncbi:hypothetical protein SAMN05216241_102237 [Limimonas halophila]|uniref:Tetratricopeptide repeat-containing protein n=1 Tax=Limimonas halophila TaxID=1082479 RepID=A0A1G7NNL2_9PROT|nr:hypothetical protein SAMN05216241_102237 [Limimonas halophila]